MPPLRASTPTAPALVALALLSAAAGCAREEPIHDAATLYTPESLAQELAFRCRSIRPGTRSAAKGAPPKRDEEVLTKGQEATKEAAAPTLDDVCADIARKAGRVGGMTRPEAIRKIAGLVEADATLRPADKALLAGSLNHLADQP